MPIYNKGRFKLSEIIQPQFGNNWPTAQVTTTSDVIEVSSNLYFTNARVYSNVIALLPALAGSGIAIQANGQISANAAVVTFGAISQFLTTSNVSEGSNLYYTNARVISAVLPYLTTSNVAEGSNLYYTNDRVYATIQGNLVLKANVVDLTTANVSELTNLYYTNARVNSFIQGNLATKANVTDLTSANISELTNLYYTNTRVYSNVIALLPTLAGQNITIEANGQISANTQSVSLAGLTTSNLAEGSNLYYTNARARTAYTAGQNITIDSGTGVITSTAGTTVVNDSELITVLAATTDYTLSRSVSDPKNILVINEGLIQIPTTDYTVSGTTLTTTTQYPIGSNIEVRYFGIDSTTAGAYSTTLSAVLNTFVANGSNINFPLTATPVSAAYTIVNIDGVSQLTSAYSISGSTLTFTEAPEANANINVRILGGAVGQTFNTRTYTGDGNTTNFSITSGFTENNILVFENGVAQVPTTDYTVNTTTSNVVMAVATAANVSIQIRELGSTTANVLSQILNSDLTTSNVVPKAGNTYNLGSTSAPYNKLYLSGSNSLILGNTTVSVSGNSLIISTAGASTVVGASTSSPNSRILGYNLVFGG